MPALPLILYLQFVNLIKSEEGFYHMMHGTTTHAEKRSVLQEATWLRITYMFCMQ